MVRANPSQECATCGDPATSNEHILFGSYYNIQDFSASLILNNKGPNPLLVRPTVFSLKGDPLDLPPIELHGESAETLDMARLLASSANKFREGNLELRYVYEGCRQVLSASIILEDATDRISYDELMARPAEFASNRLAGVWWVPSARSKMDLVLASRTGEPLLATVEVRSLGARGDMRAMEVKLRPHETQIVDVPKALTIQGHGRQEWAAGSIAIRHSGKPGDLVARGMIEDRAMHYSSVIEFTDPAAGRGSEIHASGLRLGAVAGQPLYPMVVVYNAGETKSTVNLRIPYSGADGTTGSVALDPIVLEPGEVRELSPEVQRQTARLDFDQIVSAGLEVAYSTAPGTVLASAQSVSRDGDHVFRAPMVDPQTKGSAGNYPWKVDDTTSTYVYLKNVTAQVQKYTVQVDFEGGSYVLGLQELAPHATFKLDLRALRDGQKPDQHKTVIPPDAHEGQVHWSVIGLDNHSMTGRSEYVSQAHGIASTFACSNCCPNSFYAGVVNPDPGIMPYDASLQYSAFQTNKNCYGAILVPISVPPSSWGSNNTSVVNINQNGLASGVAPGSTSIIAQWYVVIWYFSGWDLGCQSYGYSFTAPPASTTVIKVNMSGAQEIDDGQRASFDVTVEGGSPTAYEWAHEVPSGSGNSPHVDFSPPSQNSTTTIGHWFANPNRECPATNCTSTYTIKCTVTFPTGTRITKLTQLTVNGCWSPAGYLDPNEARVTGGPAIAPDGSGVWRVTGMGTLGRRIPTKNVNVPSVSQFYAKTDGHEQEHLNHWGTGNILGSAFQPADFYARIQNFTGTSQQNLLDRINTDFQTYDRSQVDFVNSKLSQSERLAYQVSDPIAPKYLYQNCGRY